LRKLPDFHLLAEEVTCFEAVQWFLQRHTGVFGFSSYPEWLLRFMLEERSFRIDALR